MSSFPSTHAVQILLKFVEGGWPEAKRFDCFTPRRDTVLIEFPEEFSVNLLIFKIFFAALSDSAAVFKSTPLFRESIFLM